MARWLGIDYGMKRVGIAVTDPLALLGFPYKTISPGELIAFLQGYFRHEPVQGIVLGLPLDLMSRETAMSTLVHQVTRTLQRHFPQIPLYHHDERFTSRLAERSLLESGKRKKQRQNKALLDAISAAYLLNSFLEAHKKGNTEPLAHP